MAADNRSCSALFKRAEQLRRWEESETNRTPTSEKPRKVNFSDGCIFLAACSAGDKQEVLRLLENGADIDTANVDGLTALHAACIDDNLDMVEFLVDQGAGVNQGDMEGWTPLHATASCGFNSIAKFLIDRGADLSLVNNDGDLAIDIADSDEMENLLQEEIDHREIDCDMAREQEERKMMEDAKIWLASGKVEDVPHYKTGANALHVAAAKGYIEVMRMLLQAGANINSQDFDGWTPLHAAAHWGQRQAVDVLCEHSADMSIRNCVGQTCIDVADQNLLGLLKNLKAQYDAKKTVKRRKLSPPHRDHSKKPERNTDGMSIQDEDDDSSDVEKKNKVNKENASISPIILPSTPAIKRTVPNQTRVDESEAQSWRRVVPARTKPPLEDKNQKEEVSRTISSPVKIDNKETEDSQDVTLRRAQSLGKGERNHVDSMVRVPVMSEPVTSTAHNANTSPPARTVGRSFVPPSRDEESETQRKAHAKMVRSTRRSTQGVTLEDLKSAEQFIKNKQTPTTSSPETRDNLTTTTATTTTPTLSSSSISSPSINSISTTTPLHCTTTTSTTTTTTIASRPKPESPTKTDEEDRRPSWRMKLDESDKSKFSLEDVRAKEKQTAQPDTTEEDAQSVTAPLRKKNTNEKADENERNSQQTREGTQAAIQRRKRPKRRSTGVVHVDMDEIDPDKKSQRHQVDDDGGEDEEDDDSVSELAGNRDKDQNDDDTEEEEEEDEDEEDEEEEEEDDDVKVVIVKVNTIKNETERINRRNKVLQEKNERRRKIEELKKEIEKKALEKKAAGDKDRNNNRRSNEYKARVKSKLNEKLEEVERWYAMKKAAEEAARKKKEEEEEKEKEEEEETQVKGEGKEKEEVEEERTIEEEEEKRSKIASKEAARKEVEKWYLKKKEAEKAQEAREEKKEVESRTKKEGEEKNTKVIEKREEKRHKREEEKKEQEKLEEEKRRKKEQERLEEEKRLEEQEAVWKKKKKDDVKKMATEEAEKEFEKRRKKKVKKELDKKMKAEEKNKDPEELEAAKRKKDEASGRTSEIEGSASVGQQKPPETPGTPTLDVEALLAQYYEEEVEKIRKENAEKERKRREKWEAIRRRDEEEEEAERAKRELEASLAQNSAAVGEPSPAAGGGGGVGVFWMDEEHGQAPGSGTQKGFEDQSVSDRCDVTKGSSTTSLGTSVNSRPSSRASSIGPENGDIDYKKLYEEQLGENKRLLERLRISDTDLQEARTTLDNNNKKNNTRLALAEADKREKRALERKLSEMEEELKQLQKLKAENEKLKAENRALTRVVSKLTNSATTNLGNLASAANAAK
ncbi:myosin binding subunit isoform X7 [Oratosquilla oratoria]|uniref:myosin binding subunit isoform X7 n=1 Tax=Oratosquilla oratoria TaxID=337810 RepID=UPI003F7668C2